MPVSMALRLQQSALSAASTSGSPFSQQTNGQAESALSFALPVHRLKHFASLRSKVDALRYTSQQKWLHTRKCGPCSAVIVQEAQRNELCAERFSLQEDELMQLLHREADELSAELKGTNLFLIGMMGCGKTTIGRILSDVLGYAFFDSDTVVEKAVGTTVANIFSEQGEAAFRDLESQAVSQLSSMENLVVATGGGAILRVQNWKCMRTGIVAWIDVPLEALAKRVVAAGVGSRPILSQGSSDEDAFSQALERLRTVHQKRKHLYPQADVTVSLGAIAAEMGARNVGKVSPARIALSILRGVKDLLRARPNPWVLQGAEAECILNEHGQCMVPYGLETAEESPLIAQALTSH